MSSTSDKGDRFKDQISILLKDKKLSLMPLQVTVNCADAGALVWPEPGRGTEGHICGRLI